MILYFAYWRGEQIQFLKKVNKEQDFKIHYISFVCKERCLDFGLGCVNFCSLTATEHICSINPFAPRQVIGGRFYHFKLKSVDEILWCYQYELSSLTKRLHGDVNQFSWEFKNCFHIPLFIWNEKVICVVNCRKFYCRSKWLHKRYQTVRYCSYVEFCNICFYRSFWIK